MINFKMNIYQMILNQLFKKIISLTKIYIIIVIIVTLKATLIITKPKLI
jgi:hypothetical protein